MATGLMDNRYTNTTPAGFEGVGGNPNKAETITPDTTAMAPNVGAVGGEEITDTGTTPNTKSRVAQVFDNLSENAKTSLAAVASPDTITALKEFFSGMGMSPEDITGLDSIPVKEMVHIPVDALINNTEGVISQIREVATSVQNRNQTTDVNQTKGMMADATMPEDRPPTQPV
tara:strand:- start:26 stop:544 length:519 start_codon:yes stop_codon:yes gene_type:complete